MRRTRIIEKAKLSRLVEPIQRFLQTETSSGFILLGCTFIAVVWANTGLANYYHSALETEITAGIGAFRLSNSLHFWINDGLMAVFFFVIGLEIKRELLVGELSSLKKSSLPIIAAGGGMIFPALIYVLFNPSPETFKGWGIPMATDIAFSIGIMSLLGKRVPLSLKVFLTAFAIADDLGAVLVIALFYTSTISFASLGIGAIFLLALIVCNSLHVRRPGIYGLLGFGLWCAFIPSGVHPTVAGVLTAMTIPVVARIDFKSYLESVRKSLRLLEESDDDDPDISISGRFNSVVSTVEDSSEKVQTPLKRLEDNLHPYVAFLIMPIFALANAGVEIHGGTGELLLSRVSLGIILGLFLGKTIGISLFSFLACKLKISVLPSGVSWKQMIGTACIGGIGFTMSLFVASLAFQGTEYLDFAKVGILSGSIISGFTGWLILRTRGSGG